MEKPLRIVVKIGTNLLTRENFTLNEDFISLISGQIIDLHNKQHKIVLVSSGAMASGRSELKMKRETKNIPLKQAFAAVGQAILINTYRKYFAPAQIPVAQVLLTDLDFKTKKTFLSTRNTLNLLLECGAIPIINENDVTSFDEIKFGDNDNLSSKVATSIGADLLILLTDVAGLFDKNPQKHPDARFIPEVTHIDEKIKKMAAEKISSRSMGGMRSKILAAEYAMQHGIDTVICRGHEPEILTRLILKKEKIGTLFCSTHTKLESRKKWLAAQLKKNAKIIIDEGAEKALFEGKKSLLPAGVKSVQGEFQRGDVVRIFNQKGNEIGFGMVNYQNTDAAKICGCHSTELKEKLEHVYEPELVNRHNMITI